MRKLFHLGLIGLLLSLSACKPFELQDLAEDQLQFTYSIQADACFGYCPVYQMTIHGNGKLQYEGLDNVPRLGKWDTVVGPEAINALAKALAKARFNSLDSVYDNRYVADVAKVKHHLKVPAEGIDHRVLSRYDQPDRLLDLEQFMHRFREEYVDPQ